MEVYPQVLTQVDNGIEQTITKQIGLINTSISDDSKIRKKYWSRLWPMYAAG